MNSDQAKQISLPDLLAKLGYQPVEIKKSGYQLWYHSPFRTEKTASFVTSFLGGKWIWNDFGDTGGTVIDFVMRYQGYSRVGDALAFLEDSFGKQVYSNRERVHTQPKKQTENVSKIEHFDPDLRLRSISKIENPIIISYLTKNRGIDKKIALSYLEEIKYINLKTQKEFFAFGMKNQKDSYEIRSASDKNVFKSAFKKDISLIKGLRKNNTVVNVFEGMLDFLSMLTMLGFSNLAGDSIIMHSTKLMDSVYKSIQANKYASINAFLDNDKVGEEATAELQLNFPNKVADKSYLFYPYQDLNDMLKEGKRIEI